MQIEDYGKKYGYQKITDKQADRFTKFLIGANGEEMKYRLVPALIYIGCCIIFNKVKQILGTKVDYQVDHTKMSLKVFNEYYWKFKDKQ